MASDRLTQFYFVTWLLPFNYILFWKRDLRHWTKDRLLLILTDSILYFMKTGQKVMTSVLRLSSLLLLFLASLSMPIHFAVWQFAISSWRFLCTLSEMTDKCPSQSILVISAWTWSFFLVLLLQHFWHRKVIHLDFRRFSIN